MREPRMRMLKREPGMRMLKRDLGTMSQALSEDAISISRVLEQKLEE